MEGKEEDVKLGANKYSERQPIGTSAQTDKDYKEPPPAPLFEPGELSSWSFYRAGIAEFIATFLFLYISVLTVMGVVKSPTKCGTVGIQGIAWAFGGMIFALVYCTAGISGGHINPAVTFGLLLARKLSLTRALFYMVMQCLGAICGAGVVKGFMGKHDYTTLGGGANTVAHGYTKGSGLGAEIVGTFVLVYTVFSYDQPLMTSPNSSVKSKSSTMEDDDGACSTPCRRDANCNCKICQASINATLDLLPMSVQKTSKPSPPETPLFFNPSTVSTPISETSRLTVSPPPVKSTDLKLKHERKKTGFGYALMTLKCVLVLCLSLVGKLGFSYVSSRVMRTELSQEIVRDIGEKSLGFQDVTEKLGFLNDELQNVLGVVEVRSKIPNWEIVQDGLILRSRCLLYKSVMEEVSIWGWPLQTSGLVSTDFASRSFTILSGRVTEWSNGESGGLIRTTNTSWEQGKWSTSVWRLDENTWILEYKRSFLFDNNTRQFSSVMEFLRFKMMRSFQWMKQLWKFSDAHHLAPT